MVINMNFNDPDKTNDELSLNEGKLFLILKQYFVLYDLSVWLKNLLFQIFVLVVKM